MAHIDTAPIEEAYFKRLLHETDPREAICRLAERWGVRESSTEPWLGLSQPEHQVTMVLIYVGEVGNGGHTQFFSNRGGEVALRVRAAAREIDLVELDIVLGDAFAVFPNGQPPADRAEVDRLPDSWGDDRAAEFARLDRRVWRLDPYPALIAYLRSHEQEVLRSERGLAESPPVDPLSARTARS